MRIAIWVLAAAVCCGCSSVDDKNGTTNNGATNNGATNNGATNNGATNNGATNNGTTNNGATNGTTGTNNVVTPEDCADDEVFVSDYCTRCGQANGCDETGPECRPACTNEGEPCESGGFCSDGACRRFCG